MAIATCDSGSAAVPTRTGGPSGPATSGPRAHADAGDGGLPGADAAPGPDGAPYQYPDAAADCGIGFRGEPSDLACTGLYSDWPTKTVAAGVEPYSPAFASWDDGATGPRWIALPAGTQIDTSDMDSWVFPVDTRVWQELGLPLGGASSPVRVETRLLWKQAEGIWLRTTYRWSSDGQTSATELLGGEQNVGGTPYDVPARAECDQCHNGRADGVLGFEAVSLAAPGATGLTLQALQARGLLSAPPAPPIVVPGNATESAALGWLHANCGTSCHNAAHGSAGSSGLLLSLDVATLSTVQTTNAYVTGWNALTSGYENPPDAASSYRIHACDPAGSTAYYRASVRDGVGGVSFGTQMPNVLSRVPDDAGLAVFAAWIDEGCGAGP